MKLLFPLPFPARLARCWLGAVLLCLAFLPPLLPLRARAEAPETGQRAGKVEIPFEWEGGLIWVNVEAHGKRLRFVVDSGAGKTVLNLDAMRRLRLKPGAPRPLLAVGRRGVAYRLDDFNGSLAGIPLGPEVYAVPLRRARGEGWGWSRWMGRRIDGLVGCDFFRGRIVEIDYRARRLSILERVEPKPGAASLPVRNLNDTLCVPVCINGSPPRWTRFDTGCTASLEWVDAQEAARSGSATEAQVQLGSLRRAGVRVGLHGTPFFPGESGLLGNGLLSHYRVTLDAPAMRLWLEER